jgi:molybdopterin synthase catalytic subunit
MFLIELTDETIDTRKLLAFVVDPACGAEVLFVGTTRQWTRLEQQAGAAPSETASGQTTDTQDSQVIETDFLIYEAYREMALAQMEQLAQTARVTWPIARIAMVHRLGKVMPTEASVAIAVSSPHRREAFEAAQWLIDELKHRVPIWKQEHYVQHGSQWIHPTAGSCQCQPVKLVERPLFG